MAKVKKAIITDAGFASRYLPVTKTIPKAMIPVGAKPVMQYCVEECAEAGIEEIIIVATPNTKAREIYDKLLAVGDLRDTFVMADDSGLCIDALGGEPGVHSARFMGHDTDYHVKRMKLLEMLKDVPWEKRGARFTASICMIRENGEAVTETASMEGHIALQEAGEGGFGYDAIFEADAFPGKTTAEITEEEKNSISHRGKALRLIRARCNNV